MVWHISKGWHVGILDNDLNYDLGHHTPFIIMHIECTCIATCLFCGGFRSLLLLYVHPVVICANNSKFYSKLKAYYGTNLGSRNKIINCSWMEEGVGMLYMKC